VVLYASVLLLLEQNLTDLVLSVAVCSCAPEFPALVTPVHCQSAQVAVRTDGLVVSLVMPGSRIQVAGIPWQSLQGTLFKQVDL
jgi:hypothetical protein